MIELALVTAYEMFVIAGGILLFMGVWATWEWFENRAWRKDNRRRED